MLRTRWKLILGLSALAALTGVSAVNKYHRDNLRCSPEELRFPGTLILDKKLDYWFDRNTYGEVWFKADTRECQIR